MRRVLDWSNPIGPFVAETWVDYLIDHYEQILAWVQPLSRDQLVARHWENAVEILDQQPEPKTLAEANQRWRRFVAAVWGILEGARVRRVQATAARKKHRG